MSVVLESNKIIITIPTANPVDDLHHFQKNLLEIFQDLHPDYSGDTYHAFWLAKEMVPDKNTYRSLDENCNFEVDPLKQIITSFGPRAMLHSLLKAQTYLYNYATTLEARDIELEDVISHIKEITEAVNKGIKKTQVGSVMKKAG